MTAIASTTLSLILVLSLPSAWAAEQETRAGEVARIMKMLRSGTFEERRPAYQALAFSGLTEAEVFDEMRARLGRMYLYAGHDGDAVSELRYLVEALASSGNRAYRSDIAMVADAGRRVHKKARVHAEKALSLLEAYVQWNPIISAPRAGLSWPRARVENMLDSSDLELKREGLRRAKALRDSEPAVFDSVERQLNELVNANISDPNVEDVAAWACKVLAYSGNPKYHASLNAVATATADGKQKRYCSDAIAEAAKEQEAERAAAVEAKLGPKAVARLRQLDDMRRKRILNEENYQKKRKAVLDACEAGLCEQ